MVWSAVFSDMDSMSILYCSREASLGGSCSRWLCRAGPNESRISVSSTLLNDDGEASELSMYDLNRCKPVENVPVNQDKLAVFECLYVYLLTGMISLVAGFYLDSWKGTDDALRTPHP